MCGISIVISKKHQPVSETVIRCMTDCVQHRGPEGEGFYFYKNAALGHRRLAIIDVSDAGLQPMHWKDDLTIVFNGEIYNYLELRQELVQQGYSFKTQTDTEVILAAYHCWGQNCQQHFNGMWAFAVLDKRDQTLFCSRDRFGVKPFYYAHEPGGFYAGSEIKQLLPFISSRKVSYPAVADYLLLHRSDHTSETFFDRIKNLRGGHQLVYHLDKDSFVISQWYELQFHPDINQLPERDFLNLFEEQGQRSVRWRMRSDVRVGTCLSGGLDSSYIAALSAMQHRSSGSAEAFNAITAQSVETATDETGYAGLVADQYHLNWHVTKPCREDFENALDTVIHLQEEPFADLSVYMQYFVMQQAKAAGITVLLDGQGADESLLGYSRYIFQPMQGQSVFQKLAQVPGIREKYGLGFKETVLQAFYFNNAGLKLQRQKTRFLHLQKGVMEACRIDALSKVPTGLRQLQQQEMLSDSLPLLLRYEDKNAMHFSIEARLPFLDWQLVETVFSMNDELRFKNGWSKYILRKANEKLLPPAIAWRRKKLGFVAPEESWLTNRKQLEPAIRNSPFLKELFDNQLPAYQSNQQFWKLYNLQRWASCFDAHL